jgi:hypothetical protein
MQLKKLAEHHSPAAVIELAVEKGWTGLQYGAAELNQQPALGEGDWN